MKRPLYVFIGVIALLGVFFVAQPEIATAQSSSVTAGLDAAAQVGYGTTKATPLATLIGRLISTLLSLTGIIFLVLMVYGGVMYMTASGDKDRVQKAKRIITQSLIGLIIVVAAYALTNTVVSALVTATK